MTNLTDATCEHGMSGFCAFCKTVPATPGDIESYRSTLCDFGWAQEKMSDEQVLSVFQVGVSRLRLRSPIAVFLDSVVGIVVTIAVYCVVLLAGLALFLAVL